MAVKALKYGLNFGLSFAVGFYTAFVLTMLWDWFVTEAFHVSEISYWNMYGLVLIFRLLRPTDEAAVYEQKWERLMKIVESCIPEEKRMETLKEIDKDSLGMNAQLMIANATGLIGSTVTLIIGWFVHTILA
jgi:hypothetical protein